MSTGLKFLQLYPVISVLNTGAGLHLTRADALGPNWLHSIHQRNMLEFQGASNTTIVGSWPITLHLSIGESRIRVTFGIADSFTVSVLLETTSIYKVIRKIHPAEGKIVPHHSPPVPVLIVHEFRSGAEKMKSEDRQEIEENLALLVALTKSKPRTTTTARQAALKPYVRHQY